MGRFARFSDIDDLVAFTFVIPNASVEPTVVEFCKATFDVVEVREKKTTPKSPEIFRFDSTRVIARVKRPPDQADFPGSSIYNYLFEVQVRTAFEHAWSVATHDLVYKAGSIDWKRMRLAAQLKASSEGLDAAVAAFDHLAAAIDQSPWPSVKDRIDFSRYVGSLFDANRLPNVLRPESISRFSENVCNLVKSVQPQLSVQTSLNEIEAGLVDLGPGLVPVSLSLYQFFFGILCRRGLVKMVRDLRCHITPELTAIFPETKGVAAIFDYES